MMLVGLDEDFEEDVKCKLMKSWLVG